MVFRRFYDTSIAQASFLIGCAESGEAVVVDPNRDVEVYIRAAETERLRIVAITETHIHADFVSGARELAARTGGTLYLSAEGGPDWQYTYGAEEGAVALHDGDEVRVGKVVLTVMHTPGHTPEHLVFLVTDKASSSEPVGMLSGDFLFVGDVGRPDLLEVAAGVKDTMRVGAETLFGSLAKVRKLRNDLLVWPGHGAGSACGKALGGLPETTLGYEMATNWAFKGDEGSFVAEVLSDQPEPPRYFATMKRVNKEGPSLVGKLAAPPQYGASRLPSVLDSGATVVDVRYYDPFEAEHVKGTVGMPLDDAFAKEAGSLLDEKAPVYLIAVDEGQAREAAAVMLKIGLEGVFGWFEAAPALWAMRRLGRTGPLPMIEPNAYLERLRDGSMAGLDVRGRAELAQGEVAEAKLIPLVELAGRLSEIDRSRPVGVFCQGGGRSMVATSFLRRHGIDASNVAGGLEAIQAL
ncbi:MAG: MBL fold metallo-hydrolase [Fimbriimonadaceae bacterium]|nr:MBL fold metallo-hydrolase [Fimbriimonadaceae bacterium]